MKDEKKIKMPKRAGAISLAALVVLFVMFVLLGTIAVVKRKNNDKVDAEAGTRMNEEMMSELDDIDIYLSTLEKGVADNKATLDTIQNSKETETLEKEMDSQKTILSTLVEKVTGVGEDVNSNKFDMESLLSAMNSNSDGILGGVSGYFANLKASIDKLSGDNSSIFAQITAKLDTLGSKDDALKTEINSKYESLNQNISSQINGVNENIKNVNSKFDTFNTKLGDTIISDNASLNSYLQAAFEGVNGKIDQVFQYASSGKNLLASTLSGYPDAYRVVTNPDASFGTIKNNIDTAIELAVNYGKSLSESGEDVIVIPPEADISIYAHFCDSTEEDHTRVFKSWNEYQEYFNAHYEADNTTPGGCFSTSQHTERMSTGTRICGHYDCIYNVSGKVGFRCSGCGNEIWEEGVEITGPGWGKGDHYVTAYGEVPMGYYDNVCGYHNGQIIRMEITF